MHTVDTAYTAYIASNVHNVYNVLTAFLTALEQIGYYAYDKVSANTASSKPQGYKKSDGSQDARREYPDIPNEPTD